MTTDVQGCAKGYVGGRGDGANEFDSKSSPHAENTNCNYTSTMQGTSSAAPNVSGAIALMLEANPQLTMRDVKHILAKTSRQVDAAIAPVVGDGITYHDWVTNAAGYTYHNYYGFGGIDVAAAVDAAKGLTSPSGTTTSIWQPYVAAATSVTSKAAYLSASAFYGESMAGDWTLSAYDHESGTSMMLHSYEIKIEYR